LHASSAGRRGRAAGELDARCLELLEQIIAKTESIATRKASQNAIERPRAVLPELVGLGRPDRLQPHAVVRLPSRRAGGGGNYIYYGVREFGMSAVMNGLALHGGNHSLRRHLPHLFGLTPETRCAWRR